MVFWFDHFRLLNHGLCSVGVSVCRLRVAQTFLVTLVVKVIDERFDLWFEVGGQELASNEHAII